MKNISLEGRKRISELKTGEVRSNSSQVDVKKEQLLKLKDQADNETSLQYIGKIVKDLREYYFSLLQGGTESRYKFSQYQCHVMLIKKIKGLLAQKAFENKQKGMIEKENKKNCQDFIDDIANGLRQADIEVGTLNVM